MMSVQNILYTLQAFTTLLLFIFRNESKTRFVNQLLVRSIGMHAKCFFYKQHNLKNVVFERKEYFAAF